MCDQIDAYIKRHMRHQHTGGLGEICAGAFWMALALLDFVQRAAPSASIWHKDVTFYVCVFALVFLGLHGHKVLKNRITFPRSGYVKFREIGTRAWRQGIIVGAVAASYAFVFHHMARYSPEIVSVIIASAGWGLIYALVTRLDEAWRWVALLILIMVPPAAATLALGRLWLGNLPFVLQGLIIFTSGSCALAIYLRRNRLPVQAAE